MDIHGKPAIPLKYKGVDDFQEGLAAVTTDGNRYGFIDRKGSLFSPNVMTASVRTTTFWRGTIRERPGAAGGKDVLASSTRMALGRSCRSTGSGSRSKTASHPSGSRPTGICGPMAAPSISVRLKPRDHAAVASLRCSVGARQSGIRMKPASTPESSPRTRLQDD